MKDSLLIIDGLNYLFRAYFGITDAIKTKSGISVNAVYGFFAFLRKATESVNPKYLIVIFDSEYAAKNKQIDFEDYKANRNYEDTGMFLQLRIIKRILTLMGIKYVEENNIEADDLIGTYCLFAKNQNCNVYISSNDFDFMQLISEHVHVLRNFKGNQQLINEEEVKNKFGILPKYYPDYAAILGDKSDNIEGVRGIGKKTAQKLINEYSTVENLIENVNSLPDKLKNSIIDNKIKINKNKRIITINTLVIDDLIPLSGVEFIKEVLSVKTVIYLNELHI